MASGPSPSTPDPRATRVTSTPATRFVRLHQPAPNLGGVTLTFLAAGADAAAHTTSNGLLASVATTDPARAQKIEAGLAELIKHDDAMMSWLEADPAHAAQFAADPVSAVHAALPDLPADFFDGWSGAQQARGPRSNPPR
jgi:hypothetical protein